MDKLVIKSTYLIGIPLLHKDYTASTKEDSYRRK